jgi:hypothetical protein
MFDTPISPWPSKGPEDHTGPQVEFLFNTPEYMVKASADILTILPGNTSFEKGRLSRSTIFPMKCLYCDYLHSLTRWMMFSIETSLTVPPDAIVFKQTAYRNIKHTDAMKPGSKSTRRLKKGYAIDYAVALPFLQTKQVTKGQRL